MDRLERGEWDKSTKESVETRILGGGGKELKGLLAAPYTLGGMQTLGLAARASHEPTLQATFLLQVFVLEKENLLEMDA